MNQGPSPTPPAMPAAPLPPPRQGMSTGCLITLVVGLIVAFTVVVLGVLAFVGVAGGKTVIKKTRELQAKAAMQSLEIGIRNYQTEYLNLPFHTSPPPAVDGDARDSTEASGKALLDVLLGADRERNPREVRFWEPMPTTTKGGGYTPAGGLVDPWGHSGYRILLDDNGDGHIADPEKVLGDISGSVLIYSAGEDGDFGTWGDNVCSWK